MLSDYYHVFLFLYPQILFAKGTIVQITDNKGEVAIVENFKAEYSATGNWSPGHLPMRTAKYIGFKLFVKEGRITAEEYIKIPFEDIESIKKIGRDKLEIKMKNNGKVIFDGNGSAGGKLSMFGHGSFQQMDSNGILLRSTKDARISMGSVQGEEITIDGFSGNARTKSSKVGEYTIPLEEIGIIEFQ